MLAIKYKLKCVNKFNFENAYISYYNSDEYIYSTKYLFCKMSKTPIHNFILPLSNLTNVSFSRIERRTPISILRSSSLRQFSAVRRREHFIRTLLSASRDLAIKRMVFPIHILSFPAIQTIGFEWDKIVTFLFLPFYFFYIYTFYTYKIKNYSFFF